MTALNRPTPAALREHLQSRELTRRRPTPLIPAPETILRLGAIVGSVIQCHTSMDRTMDQARRHIADLAHTGSSVASGTVILADTLHGSKGRFSRTWHAPPGGLWGCLILADTFLPRARTLLPLTLGIACCEAVRDMGVNDAHIRWVNDVLARGRKLAGFLVETFHSTHHGEDFHLLGFGINLNNTSFPPELNDAAISLCHLLGNPVNLHDFTLAFLAKMTWNIGLLCHEEELELHRAHIPDGRHDHRVLEQWKKLSDTVGQKVLYGYDVEQKPQYKATVTGISDDGGLIMQLADGTEIVEHSGELRYL